MNTPSPLIPQGATPARGKSTFFFKVLMILAVHVVLIGGMLLQGCKDTNSKDVSATGATPDTTPAAGPDTNVVPTANPASMSNAVVGTVPIAPGVATSAPPTMPSSTLPPMSPGVNTTATPPVAPVTDAKVVAVAAGDTLGAIAHKNGLSLKTLMDANPGVNAKKLQIGQKINVPAATVSAVPTASPATPAVGASEMASSSDSSTYVVKAGDTLSKIAKSHHTSFKKIMVMNDLKSAAIRPGQKLKLPAPKVAGGETPAAATTAAVPLPVIPTPVAPGTAGPATAAN